MSLIETPTKHNVRVVDFHACGEWGVERQRLPIDRDVAGPEAVVTAKIESVAPDDAVALSRAVAERGGMLWRSDDRSCEAGVVLRLAASAIAELADPRGPVAALKAAVEGYEQRSFRVKLAKRDLELGPRVAVMGILNVTPDSFSDGGLFFDESQAIDRALEMCDEGADIIDVGGESTRPGAGAVSAEDEVRRVAPIIQAVAEQVEQPVSIDTSKALVAREALAAGAQMLNDVTGLRGDPAMPGVAAESGAPVCVMHMLGTPRTMQRKPHYGDVMSEIAKSLRESMAIAHRAGVAAGQVLVDPGIGFGKTVEHNLEIMRRLHEFRSLGAPVLIGTSRKSFIGKALGKEKPEDRVWGTAATVAWAVAQGAAVVRVHDVAAAVDVVRMTEAMARR